MIIQKFSEIQLVLKIDKKNRQLGNEFWTRSNLHMPHFTYFETCKSDGTEGKAFNTDAKGIVPCFVI